MDEQKKKINYTVACVNEFARKYNIRVKEAFRYLYQYKGIEFIKENYEAEHILSFDTVLEDLGILCNKDNKYDIVIGPVADDNMALLFRQYENELIDFSTLMKGII